MVMDATNKVTLFGVIAICIVGVVAIGVYAGIRGIELSNPTCKLSAEGTFTLPNEFNTSNGDYYYPAFDATGKFEVEGPCIAVGEIAKSISYKMGDWID